MRVSVGHSDATFDVARAAYAAGATSTTHLFNAMSGLDHRAPGVALAALLDGPIVVVGGREDAGLAAEIVAAAPERFGRATG